MEILLLSESLPQQKSIIFGCQLSARQSAARKAGIKSYPTGATVTLMWKHCTALHWTLLHYTALHCTAPHCTTLHYNALHCTASHCTALQLLLFPLLYFCDSNVGMAPRKSFNCFLFRTTQVTPVYDQNNELILLGEGTCIKWYSWLLKIFQDQFLKLSSCESWSWSNKCLKHGFSIRLTISLVSKSLFLKPNFIQTVTKIVIYICCDKKNIPEL